MRIICRESELYEKVAEVKLKILLVPATITSEAKKLAA